MDRGRGQARGGTLKGVGRELRGRDEGVKGALLRSVSVNLAELRRVFKIKYFWFMGEIVTGWVGQMRTYGPRGQVKGGRGPSVAPNLADSGGAMEGLRRERWWDQFLDFF
jgi:hypothetical protein